MNNYINLKIKSNQNSSIAKLASEHKFYDVAISRYYYSLFFMLDYILYNRCKNFGIPPHTPPHTYTIEKFTGFIYRKYKNKLTNEQIADILVLNDLKRWREIADYKNKLIGEEEFLNDFMKKYIPCYALVDSISSEVKQ